jgi:hypothetical protein
MVISFPFRRGFKYSHHTPVFDTFRKAGTGRRLTRTQNRYVGMVPQAARKKNKTALVAGARVPTVLRRDPEKDWQWRLVDDAYLHGGKSWMMMFMRVYDLLEAMQYIQIRW